MCASHRGINTGGMRMTLWTPPSPDPSVRALDSGVTLSPLYPCLSTEAGESPCYSLKEVQTSGF